MMCITNNMVGEMYFLKLFIVFMYVQLVVIRSPQGIAFAETADNDEQDNDVNDETESNDNEETAENFYEPFDPEKNGFLLHEYYMMVYEKYPEYDTATMKQNLNYFGDILLLGKDKEGAPIEEVDAGDQFVLDPTEKELYLRMNETETQDGEQLESEATSDVEDAQIENEQSDDWNVDD